MNFKEIIETAKTGVDIEMHLIKLSEMETYINELKPYGYQINVGGKLNPLFDKNSYVYTTPFKEMTKSQKHSMQVSLFNYNRFVKSKGNKITPDELQKIFQETLDGYVPSKYFSSKIRAKTVSQESIHRHDVIAEGITNA